jgi:PelA/Pel-15E family pectate lyase
MPAILFLLSLTAVKIVLVGDSTVNDDGGWGTGFRASFGPEIECVNLALNGRSSKSFRDEGAWAKVLAQKPKYVLIQFGHNDQPGKGPERETDPATTYRENLARYVDEVRGIGGTPVLITSIVRRNFDPAGKIRRDQLAPYVEATRELAEEKKVPLIDLYALTLAQSEKLGPRGAEALGRKGADGKLDTTHLSALGQQEIGVMAAREFARIEPAVNPHFHPLVSWRNAMRQSADWYGSVEALRIAENLLFYQFANGGWDKNIDMAMPLGPIDRAEVERQKRTGHTNIDNSATYTQMQFLAKVYAATKQDRFAAAFRRGLSYLLDAQYPNGGWPQFYPLRDGYYSHITYNDDAMIGVMDTLRAIAERKPEYRWLSEADRERAKSAIAKGIDCILKTQVTQNGKLTVWCAQHDVKTLAPAKARTYEHPSLSGSESAGVVRFLMGIERPSPEVIRAVQSAISWLAAVKITGIRVDRREAPEMPNGFDYVVVRDAAAPPLWARFYELGTDRPIFSGRDGIIKYAMQEIEHERRTGYRWYVDRPARLLEEEYPVWMRKWGPLPDARMKQ